jgi:hypothetical protein
MSNYLFRIYTNNQNKKVIQTQVIQKQVLQQVIQMPVIQTPTTNPFFNHIYAVNNYNLPEINSNNLIYIISNMSDKVITIFGYNDNKIYNCFYAPDGNPSIDLKSKSMILLVSNMNYWSGIYG